MDLRPASKILDRVGRTLASADDIRILTASVPGALRGDIGLAYRLYVTIAEFHAFNGAPKIADEWAIQGLTLATLDNAPRIYLQLVFVRAICSYVTDDLVQAIALFSAGRAKSYATEQWSDALRFTVGVGMCIVLLGDPKNALSILEEGDTLKEYASPRILFGLDRARALAHIQLGDSDLARRIMLATDLDELSSRDLCMYDLTLGRAHLETNDVEAAQYAIEQVDYTQLGLAWERGEYWLIRSELAWREQSYEDALDHAANVICESAAGALHAIRASALRVRAKVLHARGDDAGMWEAMNQSFDSLRAATTDTIGDAVHAVVAPVLQEINHLRSVELHAAHAALVDTVQQLTEANAHLAEEAEEHRRTKEVLTETHQELVRAAHVAGMAEVATGVLHDLGNALNSVGISVDMARRRLASLSQPQIERLAKGLADGSIDGPSASKYLVRLGAIRGDTISDLRKELERTHNGLEHAARIISAQQRNAAAPSGLEAISLRDLVDDAVELALGMSPSIRTQVNVPKDEKLLTAPLRVVRILVNVLKNARDAMMSTSEPSIIISLATANNEILALDITDSGPGIPQRHKTTVFRHGFTTKTNGSGFGLHASATSARGLGGSLTLEDTPQGQGATFRLVLPRQAVGTRVDVLLPVA